MRLTDFSTGIEVIDRDECMQLLRDGSIGRVAVIDGGHPLILPVNYVVHEDLIVFRTGGGTKYGSAVRGGAVAFEIDEFHLDTHEAWSVVVSGRLEEVTSTDRVAELAMTGLEPWSVATTDHWVVVHPERVTGRRIPSSDR